MKLPHVICSLLTVCLLTSVGCVGQKAARVEAEQPGTSDEPISGTSGDARGYDPLELARDRMIVPFDKSRSGEIRGRADIFQSDTLLSDPKSGEIVGLPNRIDSLNSQSFRIQIFTGKVYGEAQKELRIAEEIFDRPVFVDYEVPNFKVRVGNFTDRDEAEEYQQRVKAAGYTTAWVVMVTVNIRQAAPLYDGTYPLDESDSLLDDSMDDDDNGYE